jgi:hypothetical protein
MTKNPNLSEGDVFFARNTYRLVGSNVLTTGVHIASGTTWTELGSFFCVSGAINSFVDVSVTAPYRAGFSDGVYDATKQLRISIGESGIEAVKKTYTEIGYNDDGTNDPMLEEGFACFNICYEPTTDEKNNGFNVLIEGNSAGSTSAVFGGSIYLSGLYIKGI